MNCSRCAYEGSPEFGVFRDLELLAVVNRRCPKCHNGSGVFYPEETVESAIRNPEECYGPERSHTPEFKTVELMRGNGELGAYSIYCPCCGFGQGGGLKMSDVTRLTGLKDIIQLGNSIVGEPLEVKLLRGGRTEQEGGETR